MIKLRVLLINPSYWTGGRIPLGFIKVSSIPLGLGYIGAMLESNGISTKILDLDKLDNQTEILERNLNEFSPDIVGITSFTSNYHNAVRVARAVKLQRPEALVVMGGVHATFMFREILEEVPEIDVIVRYEGEYTMSELANALESKRPLNEVNGIVYRGNGRLISTPLRARIENLDEVPFPAHHLMEPSVKDYIGNHDVRSLPILTTRGCPFECIFCSTAALHGHLYRTRTNSNVVDELEYLKDKYDINNVSFVDDNFTMQKNRVFDLCNEMKKRNLSLKWGCSTRVDLLSEELLKTMKDAGCTDIFFGIESASQKVLDTIRKGFRIEEAREVVRLAEKLGLKTHCSFIIGLPEETADSLNSMIEFIGDVKPTGRVLPNMLDILPGTELLEHRDEFYPDHFSIPYPDITRSQIEIMLKFYEVNSKTNELLRIKPPKIIVR
ncbi:MAG: radical SAM protein [Candidatus Methanoperedens sp.]|nr:radical SAM protein [Candidatus Methanoperedens sp.]